MPYKLVDHLEGPRNWSEAMVGYRRWVKKKVYYPISRDNLQIRIDGIVQDLESGLVISADKCLTSLAGDIDQEPRLLFNITSAQKEIKELVAEEEAFVKTQELVSELNEKIKNLVVKEDVFAKTQELVLAFEQNLGLKRGEWSQKAKQVREYLAGTPYAYFDLSCRVVEILDDLYHEKRSDAGKLEEKILSVGEHGKLLFKIFENYWNIKRDCAFNEVEVIDAYQHLVEELAEWLSNFIGTAELNKKFLLAEAKKKDVC